VAPVRLSRWYRTSPMPPSAQPWYVNAVAEVRTGLGPDATLATLHRIEDAFGRVRGERDGPRWIDLDLLDYHSIIKDNYNNGLSVIPHVNLHVRGFVLLPLADLAPAWRHPVSQVSIATLIAQLPPDQVVVPLDD
jgi:2-amino-4-hydroxy-6-hydroxymethyldihydropteridine diphosphokinase